MKFPLVGVTLALVAVPLFISDAEGTTTWGACSCNCVKPECDFPKTASECTACQQAVNSPSSSFDEGKCWIKVGNISPIECGQRCSRSLTGCSGFDGVMHYTYGNMCWCYYKKP